MTLRTHTGGEKEFGYAEPEYDPEFAREIAESLEKARKRKKRNGIIIAVILILMLMVYFFRIY